MELPRGSGSPSGICLRDDIPLDAICRWGIASSPWVLAGTCGRRPPRRMRDDPRDALTLAGRVKLAVRPSAASCVWPPASLFVSPPLPKVLRRTRAAGSFLRCMAGLKGEAAHQARQAGTRPLILGGSRGSSGRITSVVSCGRIGPARPCPPFLKVQRRFRQELLPSVRCCLKCHGHAMRRCLPLGRLFRREESLP